jgi:predicted HicB family RNase H-like nuclease
MAIKCKRIIDGKTYNTETATEIRGLRDDEHGVAQGEYLYQTRFGAFFHYAFFESYDENHRNTITPYTPDEARHWLEKYASYEPELIERLFGEMPEAGSGEIKFTLRLPESLRDRLAARAKANEQSLNAWMVKCLESCAADQPKRA